MMAPFLLLVATLSVVQCMALDEIPVCKDIADNSLLINLFVQMERDQNGEWTTGLSACKDYSNFKKSLSFNVKQIVTEIDKKQTILILAVPKSPPTLRVAERLKFFNKGGQNADIINDGITALRKNAKNPFKCGCVLTNRSLGNNEMFEVQVDKFQNNGRSGLMGIGVTTHSPIGFKFPGWMAQIKSGSWMLYDTILYHEWAILTEKYGKGHRKLQAGDRMGVMRTSSGALHFFINGVDLGVAATNIPYPIYGAIDLLGNIEQVTIVDKSSQ